MVDLGAVSPGPGGVSSQRLNRCPQDSDLTYMARGPLVLLGGIGAGGLGCTRASLAAPIPSPQVAGGPAACLGSALGLAFAEPAGFCVTLGPRGLILRTGGSSAPAAFEQTPLQSWAPFQGLEPQQAAAPGPPHAGTPSSIATRPVSMGRSQKWLSAAAERWERLPPGRPRDDPRPVFPAPSLSVPGQGGRVYRQRPGACGSGGGQAGAASRGIWRITWASR